MEPDDLLCSRNARPQKGRARLLGRLPDFGADLTESFRHT
jgi:hypothetical protein